MEKTGVILAGGTSTRLRSDKGLLMLANKPLVKHVLARVNEIVDESFVVVSSMAQARNFTRVLASSTKILVDENRVQTPLVGALTGLKAAKGVHTLLLPCDAPFACKQVLLFLFDLCTNRNAAIPRWPNNYIEPLHAVYRTEPALEAAQSALKAGELRMNAMVERLCRLRFVSTLVLQQLDPGLRTLFNVNTVADLKKAETLVKR